MTELEFSFKAALDFSAPVTEHQFTLHCLPAPDEVQTIEAVQLQLDPAVPYIVRQDGFGGLTVCGSCRAPHSRFAYQARGLARVDLRRRVPAAPHPIYRQPTALTAPDGAVRALWESLPLAGLDPAQTAERLNAAAASALVYTPGVTSNDTTAGQALALGRGVCQDYAHLLLALARLSGIPARYCMGLIPGEGATHAWAELAMPEGWVGYDPTHCCRTGETYLRFACGRDAAGCPAEKGVFRGGAAQTMQVDMTLKVRMQQ